MSDYFTDREFGARSQTKDTITKPLWDALLSLIEARINDGSFGQRFPEHCPDGTVPCGCDRGAFGAMLKAEVPEIDWPFVAAGSSSERFWDIETTTSEIPEAAVILDLLEFCAKAVGRPEQGSFHSYYRHYHLSWDRDAGLAQFVEEVNLLFRRNEVAYELTSSGQAQRLLAQPIDDMLRGAIFQTGDGETDNLLEKARKRFLSPKLEDRKDALDCLWDAFERIKTLEAGAKKSEQADKLLDLVAPSGSKFRDFLGREAKELTEIGNTLSIRHSETTQESLTSLNQVDFLFMRMYAFLRLVLSETDRCR